MSQTTISTTALIASNVEFQRVSHGIENVLPQICLHISLARPERRVKHQKRFSFFKAAVKQGPNVDCSIFSIKSVPPTRFNKCAKQRICGGNAVALSLKNDSVIDKSSIFCGKSDTYASKSTWACWSSSEFSRIFNISPTFSSSCAPSSSSLHCPTYFRYYSLAWISWQYYYWEQKF